MNLAHRETWRGRVWRVMPLRIVEERDGLLVLWHPAGTPVLRPYDKNGDELRIPGRDDWRLRPRPASNEGLGLVRPGHRWSIWLRWRDGEFHGWYVNFERDHVRTPVSLDHVDEKLDLVVDAQGRWRLKDEDELEQASRSGYLDAGDVRAQAERVLADPPWPTGWEDWRADPSWPQPELPPGWDAV